MDTPELAHISSALNRIDQYPQLGRNPLAHGAYTTAELRRRRLDDTPFQRGRVLSGVIRREVQQQFNRLQAAGEGRCVAEWTILYLHLVEGRSLEETAQRLRMPRRTAARYYVHAKELLLDRLYELGEAASAPSLHCPLCGATLTSDIEGASRLQCRGCGGVLEITHDEPGRVIISAVPPSAGTSA